MYTAVSGDSYWNIAKKQLGAKASNAQINTLMKQLQALNGNKRLFPGTKVKLPSTTSTGGGTTTKPGTGTTTPGTGAPGTTTPKPGTTTPKPGTGTTTPGTTTSPISDPWSYFEAVLTRMGLKDVWKAVKDSIKKVPAGEVEIVWELVRTTDTYKKVFSGIDERLNNGYSAISEEEYLDLRNKYTKTLQDAGININDVFTDSKGNRVDADRAFGKIIGQDISPLEFEDRIRVAKSWSESVDPNVKQALRAYGLEDKDLITYALNPTGGTNVLLRKAAAVKAASQAIESGFNIYNASQPGVRPTVMPTFDARTEVGKNFLEDLATRGIDPMATAAEYAAGAARAEEAIARAGTEASNVTQLAAISGDTISAQEQIEAQFGDITGSAALSDKKATGKVKRLSSQERARFGGASGGRNIFSEDMSDF